MKKLLLVSLLVLGVFVAPLSTLALSPLPPTEVRIQQLLAEIEKLKAEIARLQGQTIPWCYTFNQNLGIGYNITDVAYLHDVLQKEGFFISANELESSPSPNNSHPWFGNFGESTATAVSAFQLKYKSEILTPNGLSAPTGYVGVATRAKLNALYGCKNVQPTTPLAITFPRNGDKYKIGSNVTFGWSISNQIPENSTLSLFVEGEGVSKGAVIWSTNEVARSGNIDINLGTAIIYNDISYQYQAGSYQFYFALTSPACTLWEGSDDTFGCGLSVNKSPIVKIDLVASEQINSNITVLSPNGGEQWLANSNQMIRWAYKNLSSSSKVDLYLNNVPCPSYPNTGICASDYYRMTHGQIVLDKNIAISGSYNWIVATDIVNNPIPDGSYYVRICEAGSTTKCDSSDQPFTIYSVLSDWDV